MYEHLAKYLFYPIGEILLSTRMLKYIDELEESQWWSPEKLRELQDKKLRALVKHAYENVPYYHRVFRERGLTDRDIETVDDLVKLPVLTKKEVRDNFNDMLAGDFKKWKPYASATSGSTGEPTKFYCTKDVASINWAGLFRGWGWAGYKLGDKRVTMTGSSLIPNEKVPLLEKSRQMIERNLRLSAVSLSDKKLGSYVAKLNEFKPDFIYGYASAAYTLALYLEEHGINSVRPKAILTTGEVLLPNYRRKIEEQFGCKIFDQYGCYDGSPQALECHTHEGYHISAEKAILEFVDQNGDTVPPGNPGNILSTDLHNYAMPFIRYAVGDVGTLAAEPCSCGRGLPFLKSIDGRTTDRLVFDNGIVLSSLAIVCLLKDYPIKQCQYLQTDGNTLTLKIIADRDFNPAHTASILNVLRSHTGEGVRIRIEEVDAISPTKAGKWKMVISHVNEPLVLTH